MVYRAIGIMSGSALKGLDIVFAEFEESKGAWNYTIKAAVRYGYTDEWVEKLKNAGKLSAYDYLLLHKEYGHYIGREVNRFIEENNFQYQVQLIASHGHTVFENAPQLGEGAAIAGTTGINVVSDLRAMDMALGGKGAPIEPVSDKLVSADDENKEALAIALIGILRWREENNVFAANTGASRDSIGGAVWIGLEA